MGKRGQIYILAALLLAVVIYGLSTVVNVVQQEEIKGDFKSLSKNYEIESSKLINSVLQKGDIPVGEAFANFTVLFTSYSKAKSPNFHLFYALAYEDMFYFGNFMNEPIYIYIPCPPPGQSCPPAGGYKNLPGCLSEIYAQITFEGLTIEAEDPDYFKNIKDTCIWSTAISGVTEYCLGVGGLMYKLKIEQNVPKLFSLSRLTSGEQILYSIQGEVGQERFCADLDNSCDCDGSGPGCQSAGCGEVCCWDINTQKCKEGRCTVAQRPPCDGTIPCAKCECNFGDYCDSSDKLCHTPCSDGTPLKTCSSPKPKYCNENGELVPNCDKCGCPQGYHSCQADGTCCVNEEGKSCIDMDCCSGFYCSGGVCIRLDENCEDGVDNNNDGKIDCLDPKCKDYCSSTKPKSCKGSSSQYLVNNCQNCGCPADKPHCQGGGSCISWKILTCRKYQDVRACGYIPNCPTGWSPTGETWDGSCCESGMWGCEDEWEYRRCYQDYQTSCKENPSCKSGEDPVGSSNC